MMSQVSLKWKCFTICHIWLCHALQLHQMETRPISQHGSVWDTSKYHSKLSASIFQVKVSQGLEVKKVRPKVWSLVGVVLLGRFSWITQKNRPRTIFEHIKQDEVWKPGKYRNTREYHKKRPFLPLHRNSSIFQETFLKFCTYESKFQKVSYIEKRFSYAICCLHPFPHHH